MGGGFESSVVSFASSMSFQTTASVVARQQFRTTQRHGANTRMILDEWKCNHGRSSDCRSMTKKLFEHDEYKTELIDLPVRIDRV